MIGAFQISSSAYCILICEFVLRILYQKSNVLTYLVQISNVQFLYNISCYWHLRWVANFTETVCYKSILRLLDIKVINKHPFWPKWVWLCPFCLEYRLQTTKKASKAAIYMKFCTTLWNTLGDSSYEIHQMYFDYLWMKLKLQLQTDSVLVLEKCDPLIFNWTS